MSFKVGQLLSTNMRESDFFDSINYSIPTQDSRFRNSVTSYTRISSNYDTGKTFYQAQIQNQFEVGKYYYIKIKVERNFSDQEITLKLENNSQTEDSNSQFIDTFKVPKKEANNNDGKDFIFYETIFAPNITYSRIRFILQRNVIDFYTQTNVYTNEPLSNAEINEWSGRKIVITECQLYNMKNLLNGKIPNQSLTKIGIQGPPGLLMCINGEPIRIGPSGIFQIRNGYRVNFLSFVRGVSLQNNGEYSLDIFIVDYQYNTDEQNEEGDDVNGNII